MVGSIVPADIRMIAAEADIEVVARRVLQQEPLQVYPHRVVIVGLNHRLGEDAQPVRQSRRDEQVELPQAEGMGFAAQVAGVMGAKKTPDLIPMCHPILLTSVDISFKEESQPDREGRCSITIQATAKTTGPTGVEMEAMTAASVAALTIYDMCKAIDRGMSFSEVCLLSKSGGKSGTFTRR